MDFGIQLSFPSEQRINRTVIEHLIWVPRPPPPLPNPTHTGGGGGERKGHSIQQYNGKFLNFLIAHEFHPIPYQSRDDLFLKMSVLRELSAGWQNLRNSSQNIHKLSYNCFNLMIILNVYNVYLRFCCIPNYYQLWCMSKCQSHHTVQHP